MKVFKNRSRSVPRKGPTATEGATGDLVLHTYTIRIESDELDGGFVAEVVELPGCMSQGESVRQAVVNVTDALRAVLEVAGETNVTISKPDVPDANSTTTPATNVPVKVSAYA